MGRLQEGVPWCSLLTTTTTLKTLKNREAISQLLDEMPREGL